MAVLADNGGVTMDSAVVELALEVGGAPAVDVEQLGSAVTVIFCAVLAGEYQELVGCCC